MVTTHAEATTDDENVDNVTVILVDCSMRYGVLALFVPGSGS